MPKPGALIDDFRPAHDEAQARPVRVTKLEVINNTPKSATAVHHVGAPGTITVFVARKGSGALDDVRATIAEGDDRVDRLMERLKKGSDRTRANSDREFVEMMLRAPVFADIRFGGDILNRGLFLPPQTDLIFTTFAYNGGRLPRDGFSLAEHYRDGSKVALEGLVVRVDPALSPAEKAALRLVPQDQLGGNVTVAMRCRTTWWAVGFFTAGLVGIGLLAAAACAVGFPVTAGQGVHLTAQELRRLGPSASARKLLAMRREALLKSMPD